MSRIAALALLIALGLVAEAGACSCVARTPQERMAGADAAFFGKVTAIRSENGRRIYTVQVEKAYKGDVGATAEVSGEDPDAGPFSSCSEVLQVGDEFGGYFDGPPPEWEIFSCNRATREDLEAGLEGFPAPRGSGEAVALLAGPIGTSSPFAALDARGRVIAYAKGAATSNVVSLSPCPGGERVVESTFGLVRTRRLSDLKVLRSRRTIASRVRCADRAGTVVIAERYGRLFRLRDGRMRTLARAELGVPGPRVSLLADGARVWRVDSRTGARRRLATAPALGDLSVSPDGGRLAIVAGRRLTVYSSAGRRLSTSATRGGREEIVWNGRRALTVPLHRRGGDVVGRDLWWARSGRLRSARSPGATSRTLARVPNLAHATVVALPRAVRVRDAARFNPAAAAARRALADPRPRTACG